MTRTERDSLGEREIPDEVYWGIQTLRAVENFPVSGIHTHPFLIRAYAQIKKAAAHANNRLGLLEKRKAEAIVQAADEIIAGKMADQFPVDVYQAGAGTSCHMNINEVIANRALEILGEHQGNYSIISPNDHVNLAQSTNDTYPAASHIAIITSADILISRIIDLETALQRKAIEFAQIPKTGRTHLMDALPVRLGDEFLAYAASIHRAWERILQRRDDLLEIAIGGTATGTGVNTHLQFRKTLFPILREITALPLVPASDSMEALQSRSQMGAFSGALKELAIELGRVANDLRLMNSGPIAGMHEIALPAVQPGSSIMPGKVNPVMAECLNMIGFRVIGNDTTVSMASQAGQFELNVMTPVMPQTILESLDLFNNFLPVFTTKCIQEITAHDDEMRRIISQNPILVTMLTSRIGYIHAAELAKEAIKKGDTIREIAIRNGILTEAEANQVFDAMNISKNMYDNDAESE